MEGQHFILNLDTQIVCTYGTRAITLAVERFKRDMRNVLTGTGISNSIILKLDSNMGAEQYQFTFEDKQMILCAADDLGIVYGLNEISERYLNIYPFWFWNDEPLKQIDQVFIPMRVSKSKQNVVRYRGWFINDEVLISHWQVNDSDILPWEMAFEALLRCGGNMVIPGTDNNSRKYRKLAQDMGLYITHHHAEPLGAEMFSRAYPELTPSYAKHPDLFHQLWKEGIAEQKEGKVIWNLGFRGQGDRPFWNDDPQYDTPEARGKLISDLIRLQYEYVCQQVDNPVCCTNLYGEIMELYRGGYLDLPTDVIKIWADNGFGKMVSRRQGNHNPRVYALPENESVGHHGLYYHVSFYDLQAANHITMLPNSLAFVNNELNHAFEMGADDFLIVNCSNIKPHVYFLEEIAHIWKKGEINVDEYSKDYIDRYFFHNPSGLMDTNLVRDEISSCFHLFAESTILFGNEEDEHAGEQFYNYTVRQMAHQWMINDTDSCVKSLIWATGKIGMPSQVKWYEDLCQTGLNKFELLMKRCQGLLPKLDTHAAALFKDSLLLQVQIHLSCLKGSLEFCKAYEYFNEKEDGKSFYKLGLAADYFKAADEGMRSREHDKWDGFYANDCLCDLKQTAYNLKHLMFFVRNIAEGPHFYKWLREFMYSEEDRRVVLITNYDNHPTNEEIFLAMKERFDDGRTEEK